MTTPWLLALGGLALLLVLWVAYHLGKVILRILVGCAALGLISWVIWHFLK